MTFLHKLAQRLARQRTALIIAAVATISCEIPLRQSDPSGAVARLELSPETLTLPTDQTAQFVVVGFTSTGDTAQFSLNWSVTGGSIVDSSTSGGKHYIHYKAPSQPGQYEVIIQITTAGPSAQRSVAELSAQSTAAGLSDSAVVNVTAVPVASVGVSPSAVGATVGDQAQFTATLQDVNGNVLTGRAVTWASNNTGVATVNGSGLVTAVAAGLSIITATSEGKNGTAGITVTLTPATVASVSVAPASTSVSAGQTVQLTATPRDASGNVLLGRVVAWASSDVSLATVSGNGLVTGVAVGGVTITATIEGQSGSSAVTVRPPVASVGVSPTSPSVVAGQTVQLTATPRDASGNALNGRVVTWGTSNPGVATVNGSGLVTGVTAGSATITATSEGRNGTAAVTVTPAPVASVSVSPASASVATGSTVQLTATMRDASGNVLLGRAVTWASSNAGLATVSGSGLVTGVAAGAATITATSEGQSGASAITVTTPPPPPPPPPPGGAWPNEPPGLPLISDQPWNVAVGSGWNWNGSNTSIVTDPTAPHSPSNVARTTFSPSIPHDNGPGVGYYVLNGEKELYVGYWMKWSSNWEAQVQGAKLHMNFTSSNGITYALQRFGTAPHAISIVVLWAPYGYDWPGANSDGSWPNNVAETPIQLNTWYLLEFYYKYSTSGGSDGIIRWWVNGTLQGNYTNIRYPSDGGFIQSEYAFTRQNSPLQTEYTFIDHTRLSGR